MAELTSTLSQLASGLRFTLGIFFLTLLFSIPLGLIVARGRMSKNKIVAGIVTLAGIWVSASGKKDVAPSAQ